jgi:hypothetical protein
MSSSSVSSVSSRPLPDLFSLPLLLRVTCHFTDEVFNFPSEPDFVADEHSVYSRTTQIQPPARVVTPVRQLVEEEEIVFMQSDSDDDDIVFMQSDSDEE